MLYFDTDRNGTVNFDEFLVGIRVRKTFIDLIL